MNGYAHRTAESTGVAKEPKTEFQAHIQLAKALSKSLVAPAAAEDPVDDEVGIL